MQELKSISHLKRKKKKHNKIVLLGKYKLNIIEILISKALVDSYIIHDEFVSVNYVLLEHYEMKKNLKLRWNILHKNNRTYCYARTEFKTARIYL